MKVLTQKPKTKQVIPENTHNLEDLMSLSFAQNPYENSVIIGPIFVFIEI